MTPTCFFCRSTINWRSWTLPGMSSGLRVPIILPRSSPRISSSQISYVVTSHHNIFRMKILKFNSSAPGQNGHHFGRRYLQIHFLAWKVRILIKISLKFVPKGLINDNSVLVYIMAWRLIINWTNAVSIHWRIYAALGGDELTRWCLIRMLAIWKPHGSRLIMTQNICIFIDLFFMASLQTSRYWFR